MFGMHHRDNFENRKKHKMQNNSTTTKMSLTGDDVVMKSR